MITKKGFLFSFRCAISGIAYALATQRNFKIQVCAAVMVSFLAYYVGVDKYEMLILILTIGGVLAAEMFNTAVETIVDLVTPEFHSLAKIAKDSAAGAVFIVATAAAAVGCVIFGGKVWRLMGL